MPIRITAQFSTDVLTRKHQNSQRSSSPAVPEQSTLLLLVSAFIPRTLSDLNAAMTTSSMRSIATNRSNHRASQLLRPPLYQRQRPQRHHWLRQLLVRLLHQCPHRLAIKWRRVKVATRMDSLQMRIIAGNSIVVFRMDKEDSASMSSIVETGLYGMRRF